MKVDLLKNTLGEFGGILQFESKSNNPGFFVNEMITVLRKHSSNEWFEKVHVGTVCLSIAVHKSIQLGVLDKNFKSQQQILNKEEITPEMIKYFFPGFELC